MGFFLVSAMMNVGFFLILLIWLLKDIWRRRRRGSEESDLTEGGKIYKESTVFDKITVLVSFIISVSYLGYCFYEFWRVGTISIDSVLKFLTWGLETFVVVYSLNRRTLQEQRRRRKWPLVVVFWWVFSAIFDSFLFYIFLITEFQSKRVPKFVPKPNIVDLVSFPFSILLCFNVGFWDNSSAKERNDHEEPLLKEEEEEEVENDPFSIAGIWSKLTFMWLNPVFKKGRLEKLELHHLPSIPQSETADEAFSLLEESLRKQKMNRISLSDALLRTIWRPLAVNAAFAGNSCFCISIR